MTTGYNKGTELFFPGKDGVIMVSSVKNPDRIVEQEKKLYRELDKGIEDMEKGNLLSHEETMQLLREKVKSYGV